MEYGVHIIPLKELININFLGVGQKFMALPCVFHFYVWTCFTAYMQNVSREKLQNIHKFAVICIEREKAEFEQKTWLSGRNKETSNHRRYWGTCYKGYTFLLDI